MAPYDTPSMTDAFTLDATTCKTTFVVEGIRYAACIWLIEKRLRSTRCCNRRHERVHRTPARALVARCLPAKHDPAGDPADRLCRLSLRYPAPGKTIAPGGPAHVTPVVHRCTVDDAGHDVCPAPLHRRRRHHAALTAHAGHSTSRLAMQALYLLILLSIGIGIVFVAIRLFSGMSGSG